MFKNRPLLYILALIVPILIFSCNKDADRLGLGLQPDEDLLEVMVSDTLSIYAYSVLVDSVRTDNTALSMLGSYYDQVFGSSTASIYTQVRLSTTSIDFGDNPLLDSIILSLEYTGKYYGDTTYTQNFKVLRMTDSISSDTVYYSNQNKSLGEELANLSIIPSPTDSVLVDTLKYKAQLRIPLSEEFGQSLLDADENDLSSNDNFLRFLNGIYITTEQMQLGGAIMYFDLVSVNSRMTTYYSNDEDDSLSYQFTISSGNARFMNFEHYNYENASSEFRAQVIEGDTSLGDQKLYLQAMAGVKIRFKFPYIKDWVKNSNIVVNEARLLISNYDPENELDAANEVLALKINDDGTTGFIPDQFEGASYYGGQYNSGTGDYFLRISRYFQYLLTDEAEDYGMELVVSGASLIPNRVVVNGPNPGQAIDPGKRFRLNLIYTGLKN